MIEITAKIVGSYLVQAKLAQISANRRERIRKTVNALGITLQNKVNTEYLHGPRPTNLAVGRTGNLSRNISCTQDKGDGVNTFTSSVGTNVPYGRYWELGFTRKVGFGARGGPKNKLTQYGEQRAIIRSYQKYGNSPRQMKQFAARPFLQPALADMKDEIRARLAGALIGDSN